MYQVRRTKISMEMPMCSCGTTIFTKMRIETMHTITEAVECSVCHKLIRCIYINKGDILREPKEKETLKERPKGIRRDMRSP